MSMSALDRLVADLKASVDAELADPTVPSHHHGRPVGYNNGCKGPLCRKSQRDRIRSRTPGAVSRDPWADAYLEDRLAEHKASLKKEKVA